MLAIVYAVLFTLSIIVQLKVLPLFAVAGITPNLVLILVISVAFRTGKIAGMASGFAAGIVVDSFSSGLLGVSSLANVLCAFVAGSWPHEQVIRPAVKSGQLLSTVLVHDVIYFWFLTIGTNFGLWHVLFSTVLPHSMYTMVFTAIVYMVAPKGFSGAKQEYRSL